MNDQTGKLLVVESDDALRATLVAVLGDAGYKVSTDYREGMKAVLTFEPDLVILGADPPQLDCCDLLSEIKGSKHTRNIRVVMLVHGSSAERTRGLDLGARRCVVAASRSTRAAFEGALSGAEQTDRRRAFGAAPPL